MSQLTIKVCKWRSCSERFSDFIEKRLISDTEFYHFSDDIASIESCLCQGRCKEWPVVVFNNDVQVAHNPVRSSEMMRKKVDEIRKRLAHKNHA